MARALSEAASGLLGFDDDAPSSDELEEAGGPSEGQLAAAEEFADAVQGGNAKRIVSTLRALMDLMD